MPQALQHSSSRILEFDAFREVLAGYVSSPLGKAGVSQLVPSADRTGVARQQQLAEETRRFLGAGGSFDFSGLFAAHVLLSQATISAPALGLAQLPNLLLFSGH